jgi:DNA polymerase III delta subunit
MSKNEHYQEFIQSLKQAVPATSDSFPTLMVAFGESDFLLQKALYSIRQQWQTRYDSEAIPLEEEKLTPELLKQICFSNGFLEETSLYVIRKIKKQKDLAQLLAMFPSVPKQGSTLLFAIEQDKILVSLDKELRRWQGVTIPCKTPNPYEIPLLVKHLAIKNSLKLSPPAAALLCEVGGEDLHKIENEILKLSLIFAGHQEPLSLSDITPHLGVLKEEHAFKLSRYLLEQKNSEACLLIEDLIDRGESPLALLGLLSKHYRGCIKIKELGGQALTPSVRSTLKIPIFLLSSYQQHVRTRTLSQFNSALAKCQQADLYLKTSQAFTPQTILTEVIMFS